MKTKLIMLDTPVIVSDEEIKDGDFMYLKEIHTQGQIRKCWYIHNNESYQQLMIDNPNDINRGWGFCKQEEVLKIIAGIEGLPSIDWNGLEEEFGWVDYTLKEFEEERNKVYEETGSLTACTIVDRGISLGFKKAQSFNDRKFSLDDMVDAVNMAKYEDMHGDDIIQSLQQPKVFSIEVEVEYGWDSSGGKHSRPKITNNSIKILKKL